MVAKEGEKGSFRSVVAYIRKEAMRAAGARQVLTDIKAQNWQS
jgi:hypothetical protein